MSEPVVVNRWKRYGKDRLYVQRPDDTKIGFWDLLTDTGFPESAADEAVLVEAVAGWRAGQPVDTALVPVPVSSRFRVKAYARPDSVLGPPLDRDRKVLNAVSRVVGLDQHERAGRFDDLGEDKVAAQLDKMVKKDPRWLVAHVDECGAQDLGFDHFVVGPGGVFVVGSRLMTRRDVWVKGDTFMVDGTRFSYVTDLHTTVEHVSGVLAKTCGFPVTVIGVLALVDSYEWKAKDTPEGIEVQPRMYVEEWLRKRRAVLPDAEQLAVFDVARHQATWLQQ